MDTFRGIRRVLWITMGLNLLATAAKLVVGYLTDSLSLIADTEHPYGHRKAETMTALIVAGILFLTTWELAKGAIERLREQIPGVVRVIFHAEPAEG